MKVLGKVIIPSLSLLFVCLSYVVALEVPEHPKGRITDFTHTLSTSQISHLDQKLADYEKQTTNQIAVLMIPSLEGDNLEDYSIRLADKWKIGQKGKDNGVILLIVKNDRKLRIEVGYGLEGVLPDGLAGSIIRNQIAPFFREKKFFYGIDRGADAIIKAISPSFRPIKPKVRGVPRPPTTTSEWPQPLDYFLIYLGLFFAFCVCCMIFIAININLRKPLGPRCLDGFWYWLWSTVGEGGGFGGGGGGFGGGGGGFSGGGGGFGGGGASGGW